MKKKIVQNIFEEVDKIQASFTGKIVSVVKLQKILGKRPRTKKIVMCHGTFDIVHPGHIRQLIYAKSKGDILVVSITVDKFVSKRPISPYIPQELRALNLAAFEIVDYVIIDKNPTPINNILKIQPDYFVKGFEYSQNGVHEKTKEEIKALKSFGGEIIFSPGDIVYSSSHLLSTLKPNLSIEQLLTLMKAENITVDLLNKTITKFQGLKIHVVGDVIVDKVSMCTVLGPASGSIANSVKLDNTQLFIGGAGVVAKHLKNLGAKVLLTTVVGKDKEGQYVIQDLKKFGVDLNVIQDNTRPTTIKQRFLANENQKLLQVDTVDNSTISNEILDGVCHSIKKYTAKAVICCDFRHGIFNKDTISRIKNSIPTNVFKIADSQVSNRWGNILDFKGFDLITPNEREARFALGDQDTTLRPLAQKLYEQAKCKYIILKLGENGILVYRKKGDELRKYFYIDTFAKNVVDTVGAGDAFLATASLALIASGSIVQAAILGNLSAAFECSKLGNYPVPKEELINMINTVNTQFKYE